MINDKILIESKEIKKAFVFAALRTMLVGILVWLFVGLISEMLSALMIGVFSSEVMLRELWISSRAFLFFMISVSAWVWYEQYIEIFETTSEIKNEEVLFRSRGKIKSVQIKCLKTATLIEDNYIFKLKDKQGRRYFKIMLTQKGFQMFSGPRAICLVDETNAISKTKEIAQALGIKAKKISLLDVFSKSI